MTQEQPSLLSARALLWLYWALQCLYRQISIHPWVHLSPPCPDPIISINSLSPAVPQSTNKHLSHSAEVQPLGPSQAVGALLPQAKQGRAAYYAAEGEALLLLLLPPSGRHLQAVENQEAQAAAQQLRTFPP